MKRLSTNIILFFLWSQILSCAETQSKKDQISAKQISGTTGKLIPIDFDDSNYVHADLNAMDTITTDGWSIKYLVMDDNTRYNDIYIQWQKGNRKGTFHGRDILRMRSHFIPMLAGENKTHIFLKYACATSCSALLTLSKDSIPKDQEFFFVINYNIKTGQVVYIPESGYNLDTLKVSVFDLTKRRQKYIEFKNICNSTFEVNCIDSVYFNKDYVKLFATLIDREDSNRTRNITENHTVRLNK